MYLLLRVESKFLTVQVTIRDINKDNKLVIMALTAFLWENKKFNFVQFARKLRNCNYV